MINYPLGLPEETKVCFGQSWDANAAQCKGGLDAASMSTDGTAMHRRCDWFAKCAAETVRNNMSKRGAPSPAKPVNVPLATPVHSILRGVAQGARQALVRHVAPPPPQMVQQPAQQQMYQQQQPYYGQPGPMMVHPAQAALPHMAPMNYQQPGLQMPGYLTIQEPSVEGQHWLVRLMLNIGRSMVKAGCHTTANFVDHTTVNQPTYYQPEPPQQV